jgi:hypothetical protein
MEMSIKTFVERFKRGDFNHSSRRIQCEAGWYDWFCKDSALAGKTKKLGAKVCKIANSKRFNKETSYVFFKNNCPCVGALYDQFSICDIESGDVLFCARHLEKGSHGCDKAHWELYDADFSFEKPAVSGTWREVEKYFNY